MSARSLEEIFEEHLNVTKAGFKRFDELVSVRKDIASIRSEMANGFAAVGGEMADGFAKLDQRLSALERAVAGLKPG